MDIENFLLIGLFPIVSYLFGSVPFGLLTAKLMKGIDIRKVGSGNIGATNVRRTLGTRIGVAVLLCDAAKGAGPVWVAQMLVGRGSLWGEIYVSIVALAAFSGHLFPIYFGFKNGGKGVATCLGCFLALAPSAALISLLVYVLAVCMTGISSVGSMSSAVLLPLFVGYASSSPVFVATAVIVATAILVRHHENIRRLLRGEEPRSI